jgi:hypothetical protein
VPGQIVQFVFQKTSHPTSGKTKVHFKFTAILALQLIKLKKYRNFLEGTTTKAETDRTVACTESNVLVTTYHHIISTRIILSK